jgi:hypothetical protein
VRLDLGFYALQRRVGSAGHCCIENQIRTFTKIA